MRHNHQSRRPACHLHLLPPPAPTTAAQLIFEASAVAARFMRRNLPNIPADDPMRFEAERVLAELDARLGRA